MNILKSKRTWYIGAVVISAALLAGGVYLLGQNNASWGGVCVGLGAAATGISIGGLFMHEMEKRRREIRHAKVIDSNDERLAYGRNQAAAMTNRSIMWLLFVIALVVAGLEAELYVVLVLAGTILASGIINIIFTVHYNRKY